MKKWKDNIFSSETLLLLTILCAVLLRAYVAISRTDNHWPDEQFETLEPASSVILHHGYLSWEWIAGYRSWFVPGLYMPLFFILKKIGITGGDGIVHLSRLFTTLVCSLVIFRLNTILKILNISFWPRLIALAFFALSPGMILYACSTLADNWAMIILWLILPEILLRVESKSIKDWFLIGIWAGLTILPEYHMFLWIFGFVFTLLLLRIPLMFCIVGCFGSCLIMASSGLLDWITWGKPFHSLIMQGIAGYEVSTLYSALPWWDYLPRISNDLGDVFFLLILLSFILNFFQWPSAIKFFSSSRKRIMLIFIPFIVYILIQMQFGHKENRFLLPIYPCFYLLVGILLENTFIPSFLERIDRRRYACIIFLLALPIFSFCSFNAISKTNLILTSVDISDLETAVYQDHAHNLDQKSCMLLFNYSWMWTHGEMILGPKITFIESKIENAPSNQWQECRWAIVPRDKNLNFETNAGSQWKILKSSNRHYLLYKNIAISS